MKDLIRRLFREDDAQDLIEYGLLASFISLAAFFAIQSIGPALAAFYAVAEAQIKAAAAAS